MFQVGPGLIETSFYHANILNALTVDLLSRKNTCLLFKLFFASFLRRYVTSYHKSDA